MPVWEFNYFKYIISKDRIKSDKNTVKPITILLTHKNMAELCQMLGLVNYFPKSKFLPDNAVKDKDTECGLKLRADCQQSVLYCHQLLF